MFWRRKMKLNVNGKEVEAEPDITVEGLLAAFLQTEARDGIAVAVNGEVVAKGSWSQKILHAGDNVEIIRAVQGG
jgi:sulfur carrier protein